MELVVAGVTTAYYCNLVPSSRSSLVSLAPTTNSVALSSSRHFPSLSSRNPRQPSTFATAAAASAAAADVAADAQKRMEDGVLVTATPQPRSSVMLSVEVPPSVCEKCYKETLNEYTKRVKIPGFRPGKKIPDNLLINYVGRQNVLDATLEAVLKKTLPQAMSSVEGRALKDSLRILTEFADMKNSFSVQDVLRYDAMVDVAPQITWLSDNQYKNLKIVVEIDDIINAEKASEVEFKRRHKALGTLRIVTDRGLQVGDLVVLDISAENVANEGAKAEKIPSTERKGFHFDTEESANLLPGFLDSIIGIRQGETRSFPLHFPDTWQQESLRGVRAQFTVECKELFHRELPQLDDSLAEKLLPGCTTLDQVKELILQRCKEVEETAIEQATDNAILEQLSKIVEVDIPQSIFEDQGRQFFGAKLLQLQAERKINEEQLAALSSEKTVREYLESERENISRIVKQMLAVGEIFKSENLQYSTEELVKDVENSVAEFKRHNQDYDEERVKEQVQDVLEGAKVLEWLKENATIEYINK